MAIALSAGQRLSVEQFKQGIYDTFRPFYPEWSERGMMKLITYAALQQSNGEKINNPKSLVPDFIRTLVRLLAATLSPIM